MARYDFAEIPQSGNGVWLSCTEPGEVGGIANDLKAAVPSAQTRSETKSPTVGTFGLNFRGLQGQDLEVLSCIMRWLGENTKKPVDMVLYSNLIGGDTNHGTDL